MLRTRTPTADASAPTPTVISPLLFRCKGLTGEGGAKEPALLGIHDGRGDRIHGPGQSHVFVILFEPVLHEIETPGHHHVCIEDHRLSVLA